MVTALATAISDLAAGDYVGTLHLAASRAVSRAEFARATAAWMGYDPASIPTATLAETGSERPGHVALDVSLAESLGLRCRELSDCYA